MKSQEEAWLLEEKYGGVKTDGFDADCERLAAGEPLGYVLGHVPFLDCHIALDSCPLIPRPETEYWTEQFINHLRQTRPTNPSDNDGVRVLDLCAGSGCMGVAIARAVPQARLTFAEIDPAHLPTIATNLRTNLDDRYRAHPEHFPVLESDLFGAVTGRFDYIVSNPPYLEAALPRAATEVVAHEPELALVSGEDGLHAIKNIVRDAADFLTPSGELWIEHDPEQSDALATYATSNGWQCVTHTDQYHIDRYSVLTVAE